MEVEGTVDAVSKEFRRTLHAVGPAPPGMVFIPVDTFTVRGAGRVKAGAFWLDKYEVTNRQSRSSWTEGSTPSGTTGSSHSLIREGLFPGKKG